MGKPYLIGASPDSVVKLDVFNSMDPFFQDLIEVDNVRLATEEEIIALKVDVVQRQGRKKDFWDLHELLSKYSVNAMIDLHRKRFEWTHDEDLIRRNFIDFKFADEEFNPICLRNKDWVFIKDDIIEAVQLD
ncbi:MAG TPA: nucleotidyl transferase AbiEii/AbiGii toxin family protein [Sphingobacteriaceae bacterium]